MAILGTSTAFMGATTLATTLNIAPPSGYVSGCILLMATIGGGGNATTANASPPSGWTSLSTTGAKLGVFTKTATGAESTYTITFNVACAAAAIVVAYPAPAGTAVSGDEQSTAAVVNYSPAFPSGVTGAETVVLFTANISGATPLVTGGSGAQNMNLPGPPWTTRIAPFGPGLQTTTGTGGAVNLGITDTAGSTTAPTVTSATDSTFYAKYVILGGVGSALLTPPPVGGPQFIAGSTPHGTIGVGDSFANLTGLITDSFAFLTAKAVYRATANNVQALVGGVVNAVLVNNVLEDPYSGSSGGGFQWAPPAGLSGWFLVTGCVYVQSPGSTKVTAIISTPSGAFYGSQTSNPSVAHACGAPVVACVYLIGGSGYVQLLASVNGSGINTNALGGTNSHLEVVWISN